MAETPEEYRDAPHWTFGDSPAMADELLALVLAGIKTATCPSLAACEAEGMPEVGGVSVVLDGAGRPAGAVRTTGVEIMRFDDVGEEFARAEGEGDLSYDYWRREHIAYYQREGTYAPDMRVVCERFEVIARF